MNDIETFIVISDDCPAVEGTVPPERGGKKTIARLQYDMIIEAPYAYTEEEVLFMSKMRSQGVTDEELARDREALWAGFFAKPQACMRASSLPKRFGWGVHFDKEGKVAIYPVESAEYAELATSGEVKVVKGMRSRRA
ncbi:DUF6157 family protein [Microtetraspora sp. NBRC 16547]|uniref:DUF6157 family protein n=1 Tax=Microtetraspora sp. NBRC 16547 TaxID=3030993 RepID=UPI00249FB408|nr:DUF6157 family protein [Microtetraspora sp. NBRC 16547]GLX02589.1 hypothetical protein Misp02_66750 [Microtetraspora sp. NBRC 16547]